MACGAALAYALDDLEVKSWKEKVQKGGEFQIFLLEKALNLSQSDVKERLAQVKEAYQYEDLKNETVSKVEDYKSYINDLMANYEALAGYSITLGQLPRSGQTGGGTTAGLVYLADGSTVSLEDDSFAASLDNRWKLRLERLAYAFQERSGAKTFKVEEELLIYLDDKPFPLKDLVNSHAPTAFRRSPGKEKTPNLRA